MLMTWAASGASYVTSLFPAAWFRFGQGITSAAGAVSQWDDQSGNGRHLTQGTGSLQPALQASGGILFDGSDDYLATSNFTWNQGLSAFLLCKVVAWTINKSVWGASTASVGVFMDTTTPQLSLFAGSTLASVSPTIGTYFVLSCVVNAGSSVIQLNNNTAVTGAGGVNNAGGFKLGTNTTASASANIEVKEVVLFSAALAAAERLRMVQYLAAQGGVAI